MDGTFKLSIDSFPSNLRELLNKKELSATRLAYLMRVSRMTVYNWRRGRSDPPLRRIFQIAELLGVDAQQLLKETTN
mgnify:CR=1 FL=1|jgi:transcriptional regulator with XRE-family HTH domain